MNAKIRPFKEGEMNMIRHMLAEEVSWDLIPGHMWNGLRSYVYGGQPPGQFLRAVLENDFMGAAGYADDYNGARLREWAQVMMQVPSACKGSREAVEMWLARWELTRAEAGYAQG